MIATQLVAIIVLQCILYTHNKYLIKYQKMQNKLTNPQSKNIFQNQLIFLIHLF